VLQVLAIIEASFGNLEPFNQIMRGTFHERMCSRRFLRAQEAPVDPGSLARTALPVDEEASVANESAPARPRVLSLSA
jgi:hypothetical protein